MVHKNKGISQSIRNFKDEIIYNYYQFRINTLQDPYQLLFRNQPYKILFLLSHMRSGSSLMTHLLSSNPEIIGYGETQMKYCSELDFKKLILKVYWQLREYKMDHKYVLDKVLHDTKFLDQKFISSPQLYSIFLLREPQRTLPSLLTIKSDWTEEDALTYYSERLSTLTNYAKLINSKEHSLFIDYDQVVNNSDAVFETLKDFLDTQIGFSEQYQLRPTTGVRGIGDSSDAIKAGRIIKNPRKLAKEVSPHLVEKAKQSFEQCSATLSEYCRTIKIS